MPSCHLWVDLPQSPHQLFAGRAPALILALRDGNISLLILGEQLCLVSDWQSLENDEISSAVTLLLLSLLKHSRCLLTTGGREIVKDPNSSGIVYDLRLPFWGEQGILCNCWALCWFRTCIGESSTQFLCPKQICVDWNNLSIREVRLAETLRKEWGKWLAREEEFSKAWCLYSFCLFFFKGFCLLSFVTLHNLWDATVPLLRKAYKSLFTHTSSTTP